MTQPPMDWDSFYRQDTPPSYSIGRPQPELATLIDQGKVRGEVLDAGCGHAALSLYLAANGYTVVGLDISPTAVAAATAAATARGLTTAGFTQADLTAFEGHDGRFSTIFDSGLFHNLPPEKRQDYLQSISRAAAPGASLYVLAFAAGAFGEQIGENRPRPRGFTEAELREALSTVWEVDDVRPAKLYANDTTLTLAGGRFPDAERDSEGYVILAGFLLSAHKPGR